TILTEIEVGFVAPVSGRSLRAGVPIVDLQPAVSVGGGALEGARTYYYAVSATDSDGLEGSPSFHVRAQIPAGGAVHTVELTGLSFTSGSVAFNVYRGETPSKLRRVASGVALSSSFTDPGLEPELDGAPDPQYDHANFYWRFEETAEQFASEFGTDS